MKPFQYYTKVIWLVPIRVFLGYSWLMEGINKAAGDWLHTVMLAGKATEADTSASVTEAGAKIYRIITDSSPIWFQRIADKLILPNALGFQIILVFTEIIVGILLITGIFTFLSGIVSLGIILLFFISAGLIETTLWYIPASICMLGGAGRTLGVDCYLIPYLKRRITYKKSKIDLT